MDRTQRILEQTRQNPKLVACDDFELVIVERETRGRNYANGFLENASVKKQTWANLRLVQRKSPGIASASGDSKEAIQDLIEYASRSSECSKVDPWFRFPIWRAQALPMKQERLELNPEEEEAILHSSFSLLSKKPFALLEQHQVETESVVVFRKHEKQVLSKDRRVFQSAFRISLTQELSWFTAEKKTAGFNPKERHEMLAELLGSTIQMVSARDYEGDSPTRYILGPKVLAFILQENESLFLAGSQKHGNLLSGDISKEITLVDDGTLPDLPESTLFDMEGCLTERTVLVEKGEFKTLLHNVHSATKENRLSTGNFVLRSNEKLASLGTTNFFIERGPTKDLVSELGKGLYLDRVEAIEKESEDNHRFWLSGFSVEQGKLYEPVRRVPITLSIMDLLRTAKYVGQDLEFFGSIGSPSILFEKNP